MAQNVQFVDCRWELGNPARGRELYLAGHIPGASFLDVDEDLSDLSLENAGRHPLPSAERFAVGGRPCGDRAGRVRRRLRKRRRAGAAVVAAPPLRPRRLRRPAGRNRRVGRRAARQERRRSSRPSSSRASEAATRSTPPRSPAAWPILRWPWWTREPRTAGAASRTRSTIRPAGSRVLRTRRGTSRCLGSPTESWSPTAVRVSRPASRSIAPGSAAARGGSIRARGASGRSAGCRSSAAS